MTDLEPLAGSFRDPAARVYVDGMPSCAVWTLSHSPISAR
jgi:hypothetical protein